MEWKWAGQMQVQRSPLPITRNVAFNLPNLTDSTESPTIQDRADIARGMAENKPSQVLQITPARELVFHGPFTDVVQAQMVLKNPTDRYVVFKVKTTAPKQYCVRPNSGMVDPHETRVVTVMLQPLDGMPADATRHKFMVQSCYAERDADIDAIWKSTDASQLMYSKLMVQFEDRRASHQSSGSPMTNQSAAGGGMEETPARLSNIAHDNMSAYQSYHDGRKSSEGRNETRASSAGGLASGPIIERLEAEKAALKRDNDELFKRFTKVQQELASRSGDQFGESGLPTIQVILISLAMLLLGLIVGKLF